MTWMARGMRHCKNHGYADDMDLQFQQCTMCACQGPVLHNNPHLQRIIVQHCQGQEKPQAPALLRRKYAHVVRRKARVYRQQQTLILLREIRRKPQDFLKEAQRHT